MVGDFHIAWRTDIHDPWPSGRRHHCQRRVAARPCARIKRSAARCLPSLFEPNGDALAAVGPTAAAPGTATGLADRITVTLTDALSALPAHPACAIDKVGPPATPNPVDHAPVDGESAVGQKKTSMND